MSKNSHSKGLQRGLEERHITLMSLGAAIGVGLFLGSATAIKLAGPSILLGYAFSGLMMFFIMRALGEMAIHKPVAGSFSKYARDYLGPLAGYITGWNYWFLWVVTCKGRDNGCWYIYGILVSRYTTMDLGINCVNRNGVY